MLRYLNWFLIAVGAILIFIEVVMGAITGFDFLLIGSAILAGGVLGLVTGSAGIGVVAAGALSLAYVLVGRRRIRMRLRRPGISSNTDALIGRTVRVSETITADRAGRVKFEGEEWRAVLEGGQNVTVETGRAARVTRIEGVTVYVEAVDAESARRGGEQ